MSNDIKSLSMHYAYNERNNSYNRFLQLIFSGALIVYISCYAFESPIRYALALTGLDPLIFLRDLLLVIVITIVFLKQLLEKNIQAYFYAYLLIVLFHGAVTIINTGSVTALIYSAKMFLTILFGAILAKEIISPNKRLLSFYIFVWAISVITIFLNKYFIEFPWADMKTTMFGVEVEVSRDWTLTGADKRAAGLYRASINAGMLVPMLALILSAHVKKIYWKLLICILTLFTIYLTTMKGSLIAYFLVSLVLLGYLVYKPVNLLRIWGFLSIVLLISFPVFFPGYHMPTAEGQFSIASFNMRVEGMWPNAWEWINKKGTFPLGVGLGGIGGAQRFYAPDDINAADNMFVFLYAYFGVLSFIYLGWVVWLLVRTPSTRKKEYEILVSIIVFILSYGIVLSMIEDQMTCLFLGASLSLWVKCLKNDYDCNNENTNSPMASDNTIATE